ncbi:MAG: hypothetical protein ACXABY_31990, partial [Candidatus Thorarchaeota archaeon]
MKRVRAEAEPCPRGKTAKEPLAEGPHGARGRGKWACMSDVRLVAYAQNFVWEKNVKRPIGLRKLKSGLYNALQRRGLLAKVEFEKRRRPKGFFSKMSDDKFLEYAQGVVNEKGVKTPKGLKGADRVLYDTLRGRGLLGRLEFEKRRKQRAAGFFKKMSNKEILGIVREVVKENKVKTPWGLSGVDKGLYSALQRRGLLAKVEFEKRRRPNGFFDKMNDDEFLEY